MLYTPRPLNLDINPVEALILSVLRIEDSGADEIHKTIFEYSDYRIDISTKAIYAKTRKMLESGFLTKYEKICGGKPVKYFHLTFEGNVRLERLLSSYFVNLTSISNTLQTMQSKAPQNLSWL